MIINISAHDETSYFLINLFHIYFEFKSTALAESPNVFTKMRDKTTDFLREIKYD